MSKKKNRFPPKPTPEPKVATEEDMRPDWDHRCEVCGQKPIVPLTGMCGPCTFGEADTAGGNW